MNRVDRQWRQQYKKSLRRSRQDTVSTGSLTSTDQLNVYSPFPRYQGESFDRSQIPYEVHHERVRALAGLRPRTRKQETLIAKRVLGAYNRLHNEYQRSYLSSEDEISRKPFYCWSTARGEYRNVGRELANLTDIVLESTMTLAPELVANLLVERQLPLDFYNSLIRYICLQKNHPKELEKLFNGLNPEVVEYICGPFVYPPHFGSHDKNLKNLFRQIASVLNLMALEPSSRSKKSPILPNTETFNSILEGLSKQQAPVEECQNIVFRMTKEFQNKTIPEQGPTSSDEFSQYFIQQKCLELKANARTFEVLMDRISEEKNFGAALACLKQMEKECLKPSEDHLLYAVKAASMAGNFPKRKWTKRGLQSVEKTYSLPNQRTAKRTHIVTKGTLRGPLSKNQLRKQFLGLDARSGLITVAGERQVADGVELHEAPVAQPKNTSFPTYVSCLLERYMELCRWSGNSSVVGIEDAGSEARCRKRIREILTYICKTKMVSQPANRTYRVGKEYWATAQSKNFSPTELAKVLRSSEALELNIPSSRMLVYELLRDIVQIPEMQSNTYEFHHLRIAIQSALAECGKGLHLEKELTGDDTGALEEQRKEEVNFLVEFAESELQRFIDTIDTQGTKTTVLRHPMNCMLTLYCALGKPRLAEEFLQRLISQIGANASSYNALIWGAAIVEKNIEKTVNLVGAMQSNGVAPNGTTLDLLVQSFVSGENGKNEEPQVFEQRKLWFSEAIAHLVSLSNLYELKPYERTIHLIQEAGIQMGMEHEVHQMYHDVDSLNENANHH